MRQAMKKTFCMGLLKAESSLCYWTGHLLFVVCQLSLVPSVYLCTLKTESMRQGTRLTTALHFLSKFQPFSSFCLYCKQMDPDQTAPMGAV